MAILTVAIVAGFNVVLIIEPFVGHAVFFIEPAAQVDLPAAVAAEGHRFGLFRVERSVAGGTANQRHETGECRLRIWNPPPAWELGCVSSYSLVADGFGFLLSLFFSLPAAPFDSPEKLLVSAAFLSASAPFLYDSLR